MTSLTSTVDLDDLKEWLRRPWPSVQQGPLVVTLCVLAVLTLWMAMDADGFLAILDHANLAFHEAGHPIYGILGPTAALYGGTMGQLTFPLVTTAIFWGQRHLHAFTLTSAWTGQNLVNIARYMADARAQELPLVGGGEHDWLNIFTRWHVLEHDLGVARITTVLGYALVGGAALHLWWVARHAQGEDRPA